MDLSLHAAARVCLQPILSFNMKIANFGKYHNILFNEDDTTHETWNFDKIKGCTEYGNWHIHMYDIVRVFERMLLTHYYYYYHNNRIFPQEITGKKAKRKSNFQRIELVWHLTDGDSIIRCMRYMFVSIPTEKPKCHEILLSSAVTLMTVFVIQSKLNHFTKSNRLLYQVLT